MTTRKKVLIVMAILSLIIIIFGIVNGIGVYTEITNQVVDTDNVYIDGSDFSGLFQLFGSSVAIIICCLIIACSIGIVAVQWGIYGIIMLILYLIHRQKKSI